MSSPLATWMTSGQGDRGASPFPSDDACFLAPDPARLATVGELASATVDDLLANRHTDVIAWFGAYDGVHQTATVSPVAARRLHRAGIAIYLLNVPELDPLKDAIADELGVPSRNVDCTLFCNPRGSRTRAHFDAVDNLTIQLSGHKRWRVAPNHHVTAPTAGWATLDQSVPPEIAGYCEGQLPVDMPDDARDYVLTPGALLTVPRGWWHETASDEASVSLHVHYEPMLWIDTTLAVLRARLLRDPAWRQPMPDSVDDPDVVLAPYLAKLAAAANDLAGADIVPASTRAAAAQSSPVVRRAGASLALLGPIDGGAETKVELGSHEPGVARFTALALDGPALSAARLLASTTPAAPLDSDALVGEVRGLTTADAEALVDVMLDAGFLRPATPAEVPSLV